MATDITKCWKNTLWVVLCITFVLFTLQITKNLYLPNWLWLIIFALNLFLVFSYILILREMLSDLQNLWIVILLIGSSAAIIHFISRTLALQSQFSDIGELLINQTYILIPPLITVVFISLLTNVAGKVINKLTTLDQKSAAIDTTTSTLNQTLSDTIAILTRATTLPKEIESASDKVRIVQEFDDYFGKRSLKANPQMYSLMNGITNIVAPLSQYYEDDPPVSDDFTRAIRGICRAMADAYLTDEHRCYTERAFYSSYLFYSTLVTQILNTFDQLKDHMSGALKDKVPYFYTTFASVPQRWYNLIDDQERAIEYTHAAWQQYTFALADNIHRRRDRFLLCRSLLAIDGDWTPAGTHIPKASEVISGFRSYLFVPPNYAIPALLGDMPTDKDYLNSLPNYFGTLYPNSRAYRSLTTLGPTQKTHVILSADEYSQLASADKSGWLLLRDHFVENFHTSVFGARLFRLTKAWFESESETFRKNFDIAFPNDLFAIGVSDPENKSDEMIAKEVKWLIIIVLDVDEKKDKIFMKLYSRSNPESTEGRLFRSLERHVDHIRKESKEIRGIN